MSEAATAERPPPGRHPGREYFSADDLRIIRQAMDGLRAYLMARQDEGRAGSRHYHSFAEILGRCARISAQLERAAAEMEPPG
jgi:hypothetical protein